MRMKRTNQPYSFLNQKTRQISCKTFLAFLLSLFLIFSASAERLFIGYVAKVETATPNTPKTGMLVSDVGECAATIISGNYLLTAAHCLYNQSTREATKQIQFYPGYLGGSSLSVAENSPHIVELASEFFITNDFIEHIHEEHAKRPKGYYSKSNPLHTIARGDLAVVKIKDRESPSLESRFGAARITSVLLPQYNVVNFGYPYLGRDVPYHLHVKICQVTLNANDYGLYSGVCKTSPGHSGGPMYTPDGKLRGVLSGGYLTAEDDSKDVTFFTVIKHQRFQAIQLVTAGRFSEQTMFKRFTIE